MAIDRRPNRPKPWRARYWGPDGRQHSRSFTRKADAQRWLALSAAARAREQRAVAREELRTMPAA